MVEVHIVSVGLSSLLNMLKSGKASDILDGFGSPVEMEKALAEDRSLRWRLRDALAGYLFPEGQALDGKLAAEARKASAELNSLLGFLEDEYPGEGWRERVEHVSAVYLLHTDTWTGRAAAAALKTALERMGFSHAETRELKGFSQQDFTAGLEDLRDEVRRIVAKHKRARILLNPTGGFKPESGAMAVIAAESGLETYYIHETFRKIVKIPPANELKVKMTKEELKDEITGLWLALSLDSIIGWAYTGKIILLALWTALSLPILLYRLTRLTRKHKAIKHQK